MEEDASSQFQLLDEKLEQLDEKRASIRETALEALTKELRMNFVDDFVTQRRVTIVEALKKALKKGGAKEKSLAATGIVLVAITLGADAEDVFKDTYSLLQEISLTSTAPEARAAAISALGMTCFIGNNDQQLTLNVMEVFRKIFASKPVATVLVAAVRSYTLLLTVVEKRIIHDVLLQTVLASQLVAMVHHDDVEVRVSAGEALAVIFEAARDIDEGAFDINAFSLYTKIDGIALMDTLYTLSSDHSKLRARKDKIKQRLPFKDITNFVETGEAPSETLSFKHQKYNFTNFCEITQLNALRDFLGEGLQVHFENNQLLSEMFEVVQAETGKRQKKSAVEKRLTMSPSSPMAKARSVALNTQRNSRQRAREEVLDES